VVRDRKAVAYANSSKIKVQKVDITKEELSETLLHELADRLNVPIEGLVDQQNQLS